MSYYHELRDFLFTGLSVESLLNELEADGVAVKAATDSGALQRVMPLEEFSPPDPAICDEDTARFLGILLHRERSPGAGNRPVVRKSRRVLVGNVRAERHKVAGGAAPR